MDAKLSEPPNRDRSNISSTNHFRQVRWVSISIAWLLCLSVFVAFTGTQPAWSGSAETLKIYLARHGETDWNAENRLQGGSDRALNSTGRKQAAQLAERLKGIRLDVVYSSTLSRARDTAEIVRGEVSLKTVAGLNERKIGKFEGKLWDQSKDPENAQEYRKRIRDPDDELDGGESLNQFYARVHATLEEILSHHPSGAILIVGHALTNQMILRAIFHLNIEQTLSIEQANNELYLIEIHSGNPPRLWKRITESNIGDL
jgi:2,3-bisphosphoglycerate-dependent phosphoglycerate mutase